MLQAKKGCFLETFLNELRLGNIFIFRPVLFHMLQEKKGAQDSYFLSQHFQDSFVKFVQRYEDWLKETRVEVPRHPWASFKPVEKETKGAASV